MGRELQGAGGLTIEAISRASDASLGAEEGWDLIQIVLEKFSEWGHPGQPAEWVSTQGPQTCPLLPGLHTQGSL